MTRKFFNYWREEKAVAAVEAGILFPLLVAMLVATIDLGTALIASQKAINAAQMISDLMTRSTSVTQGDINDAIIAGQLALMPYSTTSYGTDIAGIQFVGTNKTPTVIWRNTANMSANTTVLAKSAGMGDQNEGVVAVTVRYIYTPMFTSIITGPVTMIEESYARGRKGTFVSKSS